MVNACFKLNGLVSIILILGNIHCQVGTNCPPQASLTPLGWTLATPVVYTNGTCGLYWNSTGSCVAPNSVLTSMNTSLTFLKNKAVDASNFGLVFMNASIYWQKNNGWLTNTTTITSTSSILTALGNLASSLYNQAVGLFSTFGGWL